MWNFIKRAYFGIRNFIAITYAGVVGKSMALAAKANTYNDSKIKSILLNVASFAVFCIAFIGVIAVVTAVAMLVYLPVLFVAGSVLATIVASVVAAAFAINLFETISFFQALERLARCGF